MAKRKKKARKGDGAISDKWGRPTKYQKEYCQQLVDHMAQGYSFASFAATIDCGFQTIFGWLEKYEEFSEAKRRGEMASLKYHEQVGSALQSGQLRRIESEEYAKDADGNVIFRDGKPVVAKRTYAPTRGDGRVWGINMRNKHKWVGTTDTTVVITGRNDPADMNEKELEEELAKLRAKDGEN